MSSSLRGLVFDHFIFGILQARILEWVAIFFSRASSQPRDRTQVSRIAGRHFNLWATITAHIMEQPLQLLTRNLINDLCPFVAVWITGLRSPTWPSSNPSLSLKNSLLCPHMKTFLKLPLHPCWDPVPLIQQNLTWLQWNIQIQQVVSGRSWTCLFQLLDDSTIYHMQFFAFTLSWRWAPWPCSLWTLTQHFSRNFNILMLYQFSCLYWQPQWTLCSEVLCAHCHISFTG